MQMIEQLNRNKSLNAVYQSVYISSNLFSSFKIQNESGFLEINVSDQNSQSDVIFRLTYFPTGMIGGF
ncbi:MAG: hypothetical protein ACFE95_22960 [Candidatus Hodarchaeota archaeon]